eukprot:3038600-Pyramimonas_sp.AAC.1
MHLLNWNGSDIVQIAPRERKDVRAAWARLAISCVGVLRWTKCGPKYLTESRILPLSPCCWGSLRSCVNVVLPTPWK